MTAQNWLITGVSSGFGRELATQPDPVGGERDLRSRARHAVGAAQVTPVGQ
jgi:short-subunit dehydrogenase